MPCIHQGAVPDRRGNGGQGVGRTAKLYIWTGWIAFAIFIPLAVTSMDYFMRLMGKRWKQLQRWTYGAAVLTLVHGGLAGEASGLRWFILLFGLLEAYRVWYWTLRSPRLERA